MFDTEEFASRLMHARADKRWRTAKRLWEEIEVYAAANHIKHGLSQSTISRMERGTAEPSADDLLVLDAVFQRPEGVEYFMPRKK